MHVIATAGHVDHGKSTLIHALTGMEPDRWAEERRRGMTIDLGFAWTTLPGGTQVAFVDVPGHHRFIANMLAGIGPVPAVLLVVAADQGWCRQTGEHLQALDALGVQHGVLAITRADLGDAELAAEEARDYLGGSGLADIEAVAVSPIAGTGLDDLRAALERMTMSLPSTLERPTRIWVDRAFTIRGVGTVVTGTLGSGAVSCGDELQVLPSGSLVRIRSIESLKSPASQAVAVARIALNLRGVKLSDIGRGDALATPGHWDAVSVMDVRLVNEHHQPPTQVILHVGSAAVPARLRPFGASTARLTLATPLPVHVGERAVLRDPGVQRVVAGAIVLDTLPPPLHRRGAAKRRAEQLADMTGEPDPVAEVRRRGAVPRSQLVVAGVLARDAPLPQGAVTAGDWLIDTTRWTRWQESLVDAADTWAAEHPLLPGMPRRKAVQCLQLPDPAILDALVREMTDLVLDGDGVHRGRAEATLPPQIEQELDLVMQRLRDDPFAAPETPELTAAGLTEKYLATATRDGRLVRVGPGVYLRPDALDEAVRRLAELPQPFTMSDARQALGTTRRVALPLLEWLDRQRRTFRVDTQRRSVRT